MMRGDVNDDETGTKVREGRLMARLTGIKREREEEEHLGWGERGRGLCRRK